MITPTFDIGAAREQLKAAREWLAKCDAVVVKAKHELKDNGEVLARAKQLRASAQLACDLADRELRDIAQAMYNLDGTRQPCRGVWVRKAPCTSLSCVYVVIAKEL